MTELHLTKKKSTPEPIGMGSYNMDSHNVQRYVDENGHARNEGDIQINPGGPYPISYRAIVPKAPEAVNLLVPVCLSSSHIAYGSIRMEPVFMVLGQSAAIAAVLAIDAKQGFRKWNTQPCGRNYWKKNKYLNSLLNKRLGFSPPAGEVFDSVGSEGGITHRHI